jgi:cation diffusion facilitator family transporter
VVNNNKIALGAIYFSIIGNLLLAIIKGIAGYFGNSYALIADAIESTSDVFSSFLVLFGLKYANRPADKNHPYGHGRAEPLVTFLVVGFLVASAMVIAHDAIHYIQTPHELPKPYTLVVLGTIIAWKEFSYRRVIRKSKQTHSSSLKADAWHHRSDAITSVAAFIGISVAMFLGKGYEAADDWAALLASLFILYNAYLIFRPALGEIMDENVYESMEQRIRAVAATVNGIVDTEKCYIRKSGMIYHVDLHATVDANITVKEGHAISHLLKDTLQREIPELGNVLIHIEPNEE